MNIFVQMWHALWDIDAYKQFIKKKMSRVIGYALVVCLVAYLISLISTAVLFMSRTGGLGHMIDTYVPEFTIADGRFNCETTILEQDINAGYYIDIDASKDWDLSSSDTKTLLRNYHSVVIVDGEKMIAKSNVNTQTIWFSQLGDATYTRDDIKKMLPFVYVVYAFLAVFMYFYSVIKYFIVAFVIAILGRIIAACIRLRVKMNKMFIMGLYVCTWPTILSKLLDALLPIYIPKPSGLIMLLYCVYTGLVIAKLSHDPEYKNQTPGNVGGGYQNTGYQGNNYQGDTYQNSQNSGYQGTGYQDTVYGKTTQTPEEGDLKPSDSWSFGSSDSDGDDGHGR